MTRLAPLLLLLAALPASPARAAAFDAIAIDDPARGGNGDYAVGQGDTEAEARRVAMSNCTGGGNRACTIRLTYRQCGAYAASARHAGRATAATEQEAAAAALRECGDGTCHLVVADCVDQPLRPPR